MEFMGKNMDLKIRYHLGKKNEKTRGLMGNNGAGSGGKKTSCGANLEMKSEGGSTMAARTGTFTYNWKEEEGRKWRGQDRRIIIA
jgi:hypothetical protein